MDYTDCDCRKDVRSNHIITNVTMLLSSEVFSFPDEMSDNCKGFLCHYSYKVSVQPTV